MPLDGTDRKLLDALQNDFPLTGKPYSEVASLLGVSDEDIILRLKTLKAERIIRRIGAIFDSKKLGYCSTLCAMRVPDDRIDEIGQIVNEYPGVTHNYIRSVQHRASSIQHPVYNMWFTITARSQQKLSRIMDEIREKSEIQDLIDLPALRLFKIKVSFSMLDEEVQNQEPIIKHQVSSIQHQASRTMLTEIEKLMVKELQEDIPLLERPFEPIADRLGIGERELLIKLRELKDRGIIRRFSAILRHRNLGINANAMGVWAVPEDKAEEAGIKMAAYSQVSHCYQRPVLPGWPYNIYTMIHGKAREECERAAMLISQETGIGDYILLYSTRELKKVSMRYFTEEGEGDEKTL